MHQPDDISLEDQAFSDWSERAEEKLLAMIRGDARIQAKLHSDWAHFSEPGAAAAILVECLRAGLDQAKQGVLEAQACVICGQRASHVVRNPYGLQTPFCPKCGEDAPAWVEVVMEARPE